MCLFSNAGPHKFPEVCRFVRQSKRCCDSGDVQGVLKWLHQLGCGFACYFVMFRNKDENTSGMCVLVLKKLKVYVHNTPTPLKIIPLAHVNAASYPSKSSLRRDQCNSSSTIAPRWGSTALWIETKCCIYNFIYCIYIFIYNMYISRKTLFCLRKKHVGK